MAASVDIPKRRSLRLLEEKGIAETPGDRALRPRTRLSGERKRPGHDGSLKKNGTGSSRRVSDRSSEQKKKQGPASSRKAVGSPGDGPSVVGGEPSRRVQVPGGDANPSPSPTGKIPDSGLRKSTRRSREGSRVNGALSQAKDISTDSNIVLAESVSSAGTKEMGLEGPGQPAGSKASRVDPGTSRVTTDGDHGGPAPSVVTTGRGNEVPGPSKLTKGTDHGRPRPSLVTVVKDDEVPGPSNLTKGTDHGGPRPSLVTVVKDDEVPGPSNLTKGTDHGGPRPSLVTIVKDDEVPGPSKLTSGTDGPRASVVMADHGEHDSSVVIPGTDHEGPGPFKISKGTGHKGLGSAVMTRGAVYEAPGPSSLCTDMHSKIPATDCKTAGPSIGDKAKYLEEAGALNVCESQKVLSPVKDSKKTDSSRLSLSTDVKSSHPSPKRQENTHKANAESTSGALRTRDHKVHCCSKQLLQEVLEMCSEISKEVLESQKHLSQERRQLEHRNLVWDFETAFQENVSINGQSWHEAVETQAEPDLKILEDQLDDAIVDTAMKRKRYPKKILSHAVRGLKAEREILNQYNPVVRAEEITLESSYESSMRSLTATTESISRQISETMKALPVQLEKAQGFSQVLSLQPVLQGSRIRQDIFSSRVVLEDLAKTFPKVLETTPTESGFQIKATQPKLPLRRRKSPSAQDNLYPLRSKRKISLDA